MGPGLSMRMSNAVTSIGTAMMANVSRLMTMSITMKRFPVPLQPREMTAYGCCLSREWLAGPLTSP